MKRSNEDYIGDGVFVSFDGYQIWLRTPRENGDHEIALDPMVLSALFDYVKTIKKAAARIEEAQRRALLP